MLLLNQMVRGEEAEDLKHSMSEALSDYKKLLKHEVRIFICLLALGCNIFASDRRQI